MTIEDFEQLLHSYKYAMLFYENSHTCNSETYKAQEKEMDDARSAILQKISYLISNQK